MPTQRKTAIITGAASGMGRAMALGLSEAGFDVAAVDRNAEALATLPAAIRQIRADLAQPDLFDKIVAETIGAFGRIDILINNAAIYDGIKRKPFFEIDLKEWDLVMNVNVKGAFISARAVFPFMKERGYGKIINLASEVFFTGSTGFAHYVASKGGIIGLTRALAVELGPYQICINCIAPGFTDTEASRGLADVSKYDVSKTPLRRLERPEDLVGAALFLASSESDFMTGQTLLVNGGRAMH